MNAAFPAIVSSISVSLEGSQVRFVRCGGRALASCTCPRGSRGMDCAHPWGVLVGDPNLVSLEALPDAARARRLVAGTALENELERRYAGGRLRPARIDDHHGLLGRGEVAMNLGMGSCLLEEAP